MKPPQEIQIKSEEPYNFQNKKFPVEIPPKNVSASQISQNKPSEDEDEIMKMIRSQIKIQYPQKS